MRPRPALKEAGRAGMTLAQWEAAGNKLVQLGGDGAPMVQDLPLCELAVARGITEIVRPGPGRRRRSTSRSGCRGYWAGLRDGRARSGSVARWPGCRATWTASRSGRSTRRSPHAIDESPGRVLAIAEAAILRADPEHAPRA